MIDVTTIAEIPLFEGLPADELERIAGWLEPIDVPAEWHLLNQGSYPDGFFVVLEGTVRIERNGDPIAELGPGEFFGEIALLDGGPRTATVVAESDMTLLGLTAWEFKALLSQYPSITLKLLEQVAARLRSASASVTA